jgi:release factor glutamine methyltransferase
MSSSSIVDTLRSAGCVFAEEEAQLLTAAAGSPGELDGMVRRRVSGLPLEHILGWAQFCGLRIIVDPGIFVPRRRTELLVREALTVIRAGATVVDLGCGSGAIGAALRAGSDIVLLAVDVDPAAVACARRNLGDAVLCGDLYEPLPAELRGRIDVIAANMPYVPTDAIELMPAEARVHENLVALDGGTDGLSILRRVVAEAPSWLAPGGHLLIEVGRRQADTAAAEMRHRGLATRVSRCDDLAGTVVIGRLPDGAPIRW